MQDDSTSTYRVARCTLLLGASPTRHGEGALRPWGRCPLIPRRFSSPHPRETITPSQLGKNISPTRKIEKHTPANHQTQYNANRTDYANNLSFHFESLASLSFLPILSSYAIYFSVQSFHLLLFHICGIYFLSSYL